MTRILKPHPLLDTFAKLHRSKQLLVQLEVELKRFAERNPYVIDGRTDEATGNIDFFVVVREDIPLEIRLLASEVINHQRSSLDFLAWQLALLTTKSPARNTDFPIYDDVEKYRTDRKRRLSSFSGEARQLLDDLQPFKSGTPSEHPLWRLHRYANDDKHKLLTILAATHTGMGINPPEEPFSFRFTARVGPIDEGVAFATVVVDTPGARFSSSPQVGFNAEICLPSNTGEPLRPLIHTMNWLGVSVTETINKFEPMFPHRDETNFIQLARPSA